MELKTSCIFKTEIDVFFNFHFLFSVTVFANVRFLRQPQPKCLKQGVAGCLGSNERDGGKEVVLSSADEALTGEVASELGGTSKLPRSPLQQHLDRA